MPLIQEGDVLLFRGQRFWSLFIRQITQSPYSHAGLASWHNSDKSILEIIEFHLTTGGASSNPEHVVEKSSGIIDVYRPSPRKYDLEYYPDTGVLIQCYDYDGKAVTSTMRRLTALPYSLFKIGLMARGKAFGLRLLNNVRAISDDTLQKSANHVCSTSIAYSMNANGYDLVKNKSDLKTEPGELAKSTLLNYLFTFK